MARRRFAWVDGGGGCCCVCVCVGGRCASGGACEERKDLEEHGRAVDGVCEARGGVEGWGQDLEEHGIDVDAALVSPSSGEEQADTRTQVDTTRGSSAPRLVRSRRNTVYECRGG